MRRGGGGWLLLPFFLGLIVFWLVPVLHGVWLSLSSDTLYGASHFVGGEHYRNLWGDERYAKALTNTALFTLASIGLILPLALFLAHLMRQALKPWRPVLTFVLLLPGLTPPAVLALLYLLVFYGENGLLNQWVVMPLGLQAVDWLKDPAFILPALVLQSIWRWTGFITFFLLAGMEAIPKVYYEAAHFETSSRSKVFLKITLPLLRPVLLFVGVYLLVDSFAMFSGAYVLLGGSGGTADAGLLLVSYVYKTAFSDGHFGSAAAMSLAVVPVLLGALGLCFWLPRRLEGGVPSKG
jgi:ABC-type sugar transport system permease subunit